MEIDVNGWVQGLIAIPERGLLQCWDVAVSGSCSCAVAEGKNGKMSSVVLGGGKSHLGRAEQDLARFIFMGDP